MEEPSTPAPIPPLEVRFVQPHHFYNNAEIKLNESQRLTPMEDPLAARGTPVFKPTWEEFYDFEKYMEAIAPWGLRSGIVKVIPPAEWKAGLPDVRQRLDEIKIRHPIEQNMVGISGLFRQQNIEKRRVYSLREWFEIGMSEELRSPGIDAVNKDRSTAPTHSVRKAKPARKELSSASEKTESHMNATKEELSADLKMASPRRSKPSVQQLESVSPRLNTPSAMDPSAANISEAATPSVDPSSQPGDAVMSSAPPETITSEDAERIAAEQLKIAIAKQRKAERAAQRSDLDAVFLANFDPETSWLPPGTSAADFASPEFAAALERLYWRNCGLGKAAMYGADMPGSLFSDHTGQKAPGKLYKGVKGMEGPIPWDVSNLPSALSRLIPRGKKIQGVNTPYLYLGMWRATFAWHVEDMDLYSINYIHWGAPKHWYAVPQARANALEGVMKQFFPSDKNGCPQFLRHKSYLASPTALKSASIKPNTLVQTAGEFVITYPRGYHAGFNMGINCAESVNFALDSWLELGRKARFCRCVSDSVQIDVDALLAEKARIEQEEQAGIRRPAVEPRMAKLHAGPPPQAHIAPAGAPRPRKRKHSDIHGDPLSLPAPSSAFPSKKKKSEVSAEELPCCLCISPSREELLPVNDPPFPMMNVAVPRTKDGTVSWMAHETCAKIIPETWVDDIDGSKRVFGVDSIIKDRWSLKCAACTIPDLKAHGAPLQCIMGKCSKAYHVSCAREQKSGASYEEVEVEEHQVLANFDATNGNDAGGGPETVDEAGRRVLKTITKLNVAITCAQHNKNRNQAKRKEKTDAFIRGISAIPPYARIRIKLPSGLFEVTLVSVDQQKEEVEVIWTTGSTRRCKWSTIVWDQDGPKYTMPLVAISATDISSTTTNGLLDGTGLNGVQGSISSAIGS